MRTTEVIKNKEVNLLEIALTILYLVISVALIATVLLQTGNQGGLSGAISGGSSGQSLWGKKKSKEELLGKVTAYLAAIFMIFSIIIAIFHA